MHNPVNPEYWRGRKIKYKRHALESAQARNLPVLDELPVDYLRLANCEMQNNEQVLTFKLNIPGRPFFVVVKPDFTVITVWEFTGKHYVHMMVKKGLRYE